jgi:divalent metal cation (Fe/Co/Zn/Cd) transporter
VGVDGRISVAEGDDIACQVEQTLYQKIKLLRRVYVHYHPTSGSIKEKDINMICDSVPVEVGDPVA